LVRSGILKPWGHKARALGTLTGGEDCEHLKSLGAPGYYCRVLTGKDFLNLFG
jgi:hypothetical protein